MTTFQIISVALGMLLLSMSAFVRSTQLERAAENLDRWFGRTGGQASRLRAEAYEIVGIILLVAAVYFGGIGIVRWIA